MTLRKKLVTVIILLFGLCAVVGAWRLLNPPKARVVSVRPHPGSEDVSLNTEIRINFDRDIELGWLSYKIAPNVPTSKNLTVGGRTVVIKLEERLSPATTYNVLLGGAGVENFSWYFTTVFDGGGVPTDVSGDRGDPGFWKYEEQFFKENPLVKITPVLTDNYKIVRKAQKHARVDIYAKDEDKVKKIKGSVLQWMRGQGVDPGEINIDWVF